MEVLDGGGREAACDSAKRCVLDGLQLRDRGFGSGGVPDRCAVFEGGTDESFEEGQQSFFGAARGKESEKAEAGASASGSSERVGSEAEGRVEGDAENFRCWSGGEYSRAHADDGGVVEFVRVRGEVGNGGFVGVQKESLPGCPGREFGKG